MEIITQTMPDSYTLVDSGDYHYGALNCHEEGLAAMIERVKKDRKCYLINKGDSIECILPNDKRFAHCAEKIPVPGDQADGIVEMFKPIKKRILAWGHGNHELKLINTMDFGHEIAKRLKVPYGGYTYMMRMVGKDGKLMHKFFITHGAGSLPKGAKDSIQRRGNRMASLKRRLDERGFTDCIYMSQGHNHQCLVCKPTIEDEIMLVEKHSKLKQQYMYHAAQNVPYIPPDARWYGNSPSFLKLYSDPGTFAITYGEVAGYAPVELGWLEIRVENRRVVGVKKVVV